MATGIVPGFEHGFLELSEGFLAIDFYYDIPADSVMRIGAVIDPTTGE